jgi:DNA transformation protein and related proteins
MKRVSSGTPRKPNPLAVSAGYRRFVLDQLEELGGVTARSMFGGVGLYRGAWFFGIIAGDTLYLKVDETTRADYERRGMRPFNPYPHRSGSMQYYEVPLDVIESPVELAGWAKAAVEVARAAGAKRSDPPTRGPTGEAPG